MGVYIILSVFYGSVLFYGELGERGLLWKVGKDVGFFKGFNLDFFRLVDIDEMGYE